MNAGEGVGDLEGEVLRAGDRAGGDQGRDERVFDEILARLVLVETGEGGSYELRISHFQNRFYQGFSLCDSASCLIKNSSQALTPHSHEGGKRELGDWVKACGADAALSAGSLCLDVAGEGSVEAAKDEVEVVGDFGGEAVNADN